MKILITIQFLFIVLLSFGQSFEDKQIVIQMSIDLYELQQYFHENKSKENEPLWILDNGAIPANLELTKFGKSVIFYTREEIFFRHRREDIIFERFVITPNQAEVNFKLFNEGVTIKLIFEKENDLWLIKEKRITEN